ncbi:hypothetical protein [Formosa sp. L2A11]|uniref:hypothetical protein n=1 Tax=Formosa sp. L2A11 TaxID=2686363 RepID=UPI00131D1B60|nr:hypothetical protein [Formosa sp. L2A11]
MIVSFTSANPFPLTSLKVAVFSKLILEELEKSVTVASSGSPSPFASTFVASVGSSERSETEVPSGSVPVTVA